MSKLYSFGCSFSWGLVVGSDYAYPTFLAKELNLDLDIRAFPALCNDEIFSRFISIIDQFKKDDIILYQFTYPVRKGFVTNEYSNYESSAGFYNDITVDPKKYKPNIFANESLIDFLLSYSKYTDHFIYFMVQRVVTLLEHFKNSIGIKYRLLFINDEYDKLIYKMNEPKYTLREDKPQYDISDRFFYNFIDNVVKMDEQTIGIHNYISKNNLVVSETDNHPSIQGHEFIAQRIKQTLT